MGIFLITTWSSR